MMTVRVAKERLRAQLGWLDSHHALSFEEHTSTTGRKGSAALEFRSSEHGEALRFDLA